MTNNSKKVILQDRSVKREHVPPSELRFAYLNRISDPSSTRRNEQGEKVSESLERNLRKLKDASKRLEVKFDDKHLVSGQQHATKGHVRKDLKKIYGWIDKELIDAVMIPATDRASRDADIMNEFFNYLKKNKIRLFELDREHDLFDHNVVMLLRLKGAVDEREVQSMQERSYETVIKQLLEDGKYKRGKVKFPYTKLENAKGLKKPDPEKKKLWRKVRDGYKRGETITDLSLKHNLYTSAIHRILFDPCYHTGKRNVHLKHNEPIGNYELVDVEVETNFYQIIGTEEEYLELQQIRNGHITTNRKRGKNKYLLSRVVRCGNCGKAMSGVPNAKGGKTYLYYKCSTQRYAYKKKSKKYGETKIDKGCGLSIPAKLLEDAFLSEFEYVCKSPDSFKKSIEGHGEFQQIQDSIDDEGTLQESLNTKINNTAKSIQEAENEKARKKLTADLDSLYNQLEKSDERIVKLEEEKTKHSEMEILKTRADSIKERLNQLNGLQGFSFEDKREMVGLMFPLNILNTKREYEITIWKTNYGYRFEAKGILDEFLTGTLHEKGEKWEFDGGYSKKSNLQLY